MAIRFLVVDDASFIRDMVKKQLRDRIPGSEIYDANDGHRAIAQLKKQRVDVILSDWEMPGMSGEELLRWVREQEAYKDTPFIMVTSRGDRDHVVKAVQSGVSDFITKPFTSDELVKKTVKQLAKIGKSPKDAIKLASSGDRVAFASVDVLTGGQESKPQKSNGQRAGGAASSDSVQALTNPKAAAKPEPKAAPKPRKSAKTTAQLRFPNGTCACVVRDMSLQALSGLMQRSDTLPTLFDQAVVDIETGDGQVARVNGYLSSIAAGESKVDTQIIKVTVRFVDNDPDKFEALSKFIAKIR
ncbi:response regulator [Pseudomaricurvus alkylphenolicus]|jgi:CheY-like chemotaxis protein|uniref:response regulator n=1 Tax=Pseudomaricurvus alkylphenolicus TaxID=1306991 RepID=UPI0014243BA2|nr:response regulator [Pseudomaricurvus alkylphenolicus]NIB39457.1 response regulator [Pseudomaricurvus alkylphenolicus]